MQMPKPYDKAALLEALKAKGIDGGEQILKDVVGVAADWVRSSAEMSDTGILGALDNLAVPAVNWLEKFLDAKLDALAQELSSAPAAEAPVESPAEAPAPAPAEATPAEVPAAPADAPKA